MQIDLAGASPNGAPTIESTAASPEAGETQGSFADMLDAVAEDQNESAPAGESDDEDVSGDEWMTLPVVVPFVPVIPQDVVDVTETGDATSVEAIGEDVAADVDAPLPELGASSEMKSSVDVDAPQPKAKSDAEPTFAIAQSVVEGQVVEGQAVEGQAVEGAGTVEEPVVNSDAGSAPAITFAESIPTDPAPKSAKPVKATPKVPEAIETARPSAKIAEIPANNATLDVVVEQTPAPRAESPSNNSSSEPASSPKGVAARLARALERATEQSIAPAAQAGKNNQSSNENGEGEPSFGEWLREQLPQLTSSRGHNPASAAFTFLAPSHNDARVSGLLPSSGANLLPNTPTLPNEHDVRLQIVQSMRMQFRDGVGEAVLKLNPEHLGSVSIALKVENGGLKANVQADMPAVRQWLESHQDTLRSALAEHGLRLDQFDVEPDAQRQQADDDAQREQSKKRQAQKREAEQPVFEVVV